jgi:ABC-type uncharacterized transport system substrate-binding protein
VVTSNYKLITDRAIKYRLPAMGVRGEFVGDGGLMSCGADPAEQAERVAYCIDGILKGAKPADYPVD